MDIHDFLELPQLDKEDAIGDGVVISERDSGQFKMLLYGISDFYVEVVYDSIMERIHDIKPLARHTFPEPI